MIKRCALSKQRFDYEFIDESKDSSISYEYSEDFDEQMHVKIEDGVPVLYANKSALGLLAKTFIKLSRCDYKDGFHIHLNNDFDADEPEALRIILES